jgi:hypothetical protein
METSKDILCGLEFLEAHLEGTLCHQFLKHVFVFADDTVTFYKMTKFGRVSKRPLSHFVHSALPLCAVTWSADTFYYAKLQHEETILVTVFRGSLVCAKFQKSAHPINVHQSINRVTSGYRQFYIFNKSGDVRRLDFNGARVKMSTNSSGSVYNFDRCVGDESDFASCFAEGGRVSVWKYLRLPIMQIVPKQYGGTTPTTPSPRSLTEFCRR